MLRIKEFIISDDLLEKKFVCDLPACLGNCCRYGDSGAPLTEDEVIILEEIKSEVFPYLRKEGISAINEKGATMTDFEGDMVTPLIGNAECAYTILEGDILKCGLEKAWSDGRISFRKPLSCHLFPVRLRKYSDFTTVNYEEWSICSPARIKGKGKGIYVYQFLKEPLIRALGKEVYRELCLAARDFQK
jgi:hypothetical protein